MQEQSRLQTSKIFAPLDSLPSEFLHGGRTFSSASFNIDHLIKLLFDSRYQPQVWSGSRIFIPCSKNDTASILGLNVGTNRFQNKHNHTDLLRQMHEWFVSRGIKCELRLPHTTRLGGFIFKPLWIIKARELVRSQVADIEQAVNSIGKRVKSWINTNWNKLDPAARMIRDRTSNNLNRVIRPAFLDSVMVEAGPVRINNTHGYLRPFHGFSFIKGEAMESTFGKVNRYDIKACFIEILRQVVYDPFPGRTSDDIRAAIEARGHGGKLATLVAINDPNMNRYDPDLNKLIDLRARFDNIKFVKLATGHWKRNRGQRTLNQLLTSYEAVGVNNLLEALHIYRMKALWIAMKFDGIDTDLDIPQVVLDLASERCFKECGFKPTWVKKGKRDEEKKLESIALA